MGHKVVVFDISVVRALWETRVKKHRAWQKKEEERLEKSALEKIKEEWNFVAECRRKGIPQAAYCKNGFADTGVRLLEKIERNSLISRSSLSKAGDKGSSPFVFELSGEHWKVQAFLGFAHTTTEFRHAEDPVPLAVLPLFQELPDSLREQTHLKEWHINNTLIQIIPAYIELFQAMRVLDLQKNQISHLPAEIGCLKNLKELNVSFNHLKSIPPELGDCENLERLDCSGNLELTELPFELSNLKQVTFVDISANKFSSVPICVLRMSNLQWLDISNNNLNDLPQDIDRLEELQTFLLYKNKLTYLPYALLNLKKLTLLVVSGDRLVELPTALCDSSTPLKFVNLMDNPIDKTQCQDGDEMVESERDRQHFDKEFMKAYIEDLKERESTSIQHQRKSSHVNQGTPTSKLQEHKHEMAESVPSYTTKVSFSLQL